MQHPIPLFFGRFVTTGHEGLFRIQAHVLDPCASSHASRLPHMGIIVMTNAKVIRIIQNDEEK